jgi:signal transduction histidine kinase
MVQTQKSILRSGFNKLKQNPQLWWTIVVALIIFLAFVFIANIFVTIAQDAQDRLVNVRIGSIQDTLVQYVNDVESVEEMDEIIKSIASSNETILDFRIISKVGETYVVTASLKENEKGVEVEEISQITKFSITDPDNSYTTEIQSDDDRNYITSRAFTNDQGEVVGYIETRQTLSEADTAINESIRSSILIFILIVVVVMALFLRHAKIIDYVSLYKKLKEVDNLKDDFISMASHELKSPLAVIRGYAEFLRDARELSEENKEYARRIDVSSKQLALLVGDMLDVSRIEQDRMKFEYTTFALIPFLKEHFETFEMKAKDKGLKYNFEVEHEGQLEVTLDQNKLRQIFVNFLSNAIKYTKEGEVAVIVSAEKDKEVEIRVRDSGIGMSQEEVAQLFGKFYRVKSKETEDVQGTGLGLWITKQLVEKMKGTISVESIKGKGTDFIVRFPIK